MKRAALYARVSTDNQKEEGTIASQIYELKQQIERDRNVLVKEYIDEGYSGARLDRPALDELRSDIKVDLFDAVYFHNVDRIARDVTFQHIIIGDILKYQKQIVINGKDYVENAENKFALTVMGAVAELEKAKIHERTQRGRRHRARQGILVSGVRPPYGYTYVKRNGDIPQHYLINEDEAKIVRLMYETYAVSEVSIYNVMKMLQDKKIPPPRRGTWVRSTVHRTLLNTAYYGVVYLNKGVWVPKTTDTRSYVKKQRQSRDESEWIPIKVPQIVSKELFDRVQAKLARHRRVFRNRHRKYLLTGLVMCERCGRSYSGITSRVPGYDPRRHYRCNHYEQWRGLPKAERDKHCGNKQVRASRLEIGVWLQIVSEVIQPAALKTHVEILRTRTRERDDDYKERLASVEKGMAKNEKRKQRVLDLYADSRSSKEVYFRKIARLETEEKRLIEQRAELIELVRLIPNQTLVRKSIDVFCEQASQRLSRIQTLEAKRQFLLDLLDSIWFNNDTVHMRGFVPVYEHEHNVRDTISPNFSSAEGGGSISPLSYEFAQERRAERGAISACRLDDVGSRNDARWESCVDKSTSIKQLCVRKWESYCKQRSEWKVCRAIYRVLPPNYFSYPRRYRRIRRNIRRGCA